jgi:hypothetical protein
MVAGPEEAKNLAGKRSSARFRSANERDFAQKLAPLSTRFAGTRLVNDLQRHIRVNFPCSVAQKIGSVVPVICRSVTDVEKCLADYFDDQWLTER